MKEKYYVGSDVDGEPQELFFNQIDAFVSGYCYLDSFGEDGKRVKAYHFVNEGCYEEQ